MGGEITYEHISAKKYQVKVTLYRDCNDCKFAGQGGGTSTTNCSDLTQVFLRTTTSACGDKNIGSINLSKTGFENITELCDANNSTCGTSPTVSYGIEAHYYSGVVDFADYPTYSGCTFQLFIHKSERSANLVSISSEEDKIYTYAVINPWLENISSPVFQEHPKFIFNHNQAVYATEHALAQNGDSLHYTWGTPETNYNTPVNYTSGFAKNYWMTGYCTGTSTSCLPNPNSTPPQGLFLNNETGDYVVTPTANSEKTIRVIDVEQWRKLNGSYYLAGKVRREVIALVTANPANNPPSVTSNLSYSLCVGQPFSETVTISDAPIGNTAVSDSVSLTFDHSIAGLEIEEVATSVAPFTEAQIDFTPTAGQVGVHYVTLRAKDNQCPVYASSVSTIKIIVQPKPVVNLVVEEGFCGRNEVILSSDRTISTDLTVTNSSNEVSKYQNITAPHYIQETKEGNISYHIVYTDDVGCTDSATLNQYNSGNSNLTRARLEGEKSPCSDASYSYHLSTENGTLGTTSWRYNGVKTTADTFATTINTSQLIWDYELVKNGVTCPIIDSTELTIVQSPTILINQPPVKCFSTILDLTEINAQPSGGNWYYLDVDINTKFDISTITINTDTVLPLNYTYEDVGTGCSASGEVRYTLKQSPKLDLRNQSICGTDNAYILNNAVEIPYDARDKNITWNVIGYPSALITTPRPSLDVPTLGIGTYQVKGTNSLPNGCVAIDTAIVSVTDKLEITTNNINEICQSEEPVVLNDLLEISVEGGFWESDVIDLTTGTTANTSVHCGLANFKYVYDANYCYATLDVPITVVCKPNFSFVLPDSICSDAPAISLQNSFNWYDDNRNTITELDPATYTNGNHTIVATLAEHSCVFDSTKNFHILEPIVLTASTAQEQLCEGDTLFFSIEKKPYSVETITSCHSEFDGNRNNTYVPSNCDLTNNLVSLSIESNSTALCPSHTTTLELPYYNKPSILLPERINGCEPFVLETRTLTKEIEYTISNSTNTISGSAEELNNTRIAEGKYTISAYKQDDNGCTALVETDNFIQVNPKPTASFTMNNEDRLTLSKREISLYNYSNISSGSVNPTWYYKKLDKTRSFSTSNNPTYKLPADTGNFKIILVAESDYSCSDTAIQNVLVVPDIIAFIPNAFTPNNKGPKSNSVFRVLSDHAQEYSINIFNKWGQKVYSSNNIEEVWDGTYMGQYCQNGVYVYAIVLINKAGKEYTYQGTVNLIR